MRDAQFLRKIADTVDDNLLPSDDTKLYGTPADRLERIAEQIDVLWHRQVKYSPESRTDYDRYFDAWYKYLRCISMVFYTKHKAGEDATPWAESFIHEALTALTQLQNFAITGKYMRRPEKLESDAEELIQKYGLTSGKWYN